MSGKTVLSALLCSAAVVLALEWPEWWGVAVFWGLSAIDASIEHHVRPDPKREAA